MSSCIEKFFRYELSEYKTSPGTSDAIRAIPKTPSKCVVPGSESVVSKTEEHAEEQPLSPHKIVFSLAANTEMECDICSKEFAVLCILSKQFPWL